MASIRKRTRKTRKGGKPVASWQVLYREPDQTQRARSFSTRSAAETFAAQVEVSLADGTYGQTPDTAPQLRPGGVPTLAACVDTWTATRRVSAARTAADASLAKRLGPLLPRPVDELTPSDGRALVAALVDEGLSAETVGAVVRLLRSVLETAVEDGHLSSNPAARVRSPRVVRPPLDARDVYSPAEVAAIVAHTDEDYQALMAVLGYVGARWSEAAALQRQDVDLARGRVHLGHRVVEEVAGHTRLRDGGKTRSSDRWVTLPTPAASALAEHIGRLRPGPGVLLFSTSSGGPISRRNFSQRTYRRAVESAAAARHEVLSDRGIPMRNLRHSAASMMLAAGLPAIEVAAMLGHSRPSITLDVYGRFVPSDDGATARRFDAFLAASV